MALRDFLRLAIASTHSAPRRDAASRLLTVACIGLTRNARAVLQVAQQEAQQFGHRYVGTEHILLGLLALDEGKAASVLRQFDLGRATVRQLLASRNVRDKQAAPTEWLSNRALHVTERAKSEASSMGCLAVGSAHLLLSLIEEEGLAVGILREHGIAMEKLRAAIRGAFPCDD